MRRPIREAVVGMMRRGVSDRTILLAVTRSTPATRLKLAAVKKLRRKLEARRHRF